MQIRIGYELIYQCPQPTPMILTLNVHYSASRIWFRPTISLPIQRCRCEPTAMVLVIGVIGSSPHPGHLRIITDAVINDSGEPDGVPLRRASMRCRTFRTRRWFTCWAAAIARPTFLGDGLVAVRPDAGRLAAGAGHL